MQHESLSTTSSFLFFLFNKKNNNNIFFRWHVDKLEFKANNQPNRFLFYDRKYRRVPTPNEQALIDYKKELEDKTAELKKTKDAGDLEAIKKQMEDINAVAQKIGAAMYQQPEAGTPGVEAGQAGAETNANPEEKKEDVVEGEVEEKK